MHLLDLFGRSKANSGVVAARLPARRTPVRVITKTIAGAAASAARQAASTTPAPISPTPHDQRRLIFAAVASNDSERLAAMFPENPDGLVADSVDWMKVPDALRLNPAAVRWYGEGVRAVVQYCADRLNRPELIQRLDEIRLSTPGAPVKAEG